MSTTTPPAAPTIYPMRWQRRRATYLKAGILAVVAGLGLLVPFTGLMEPQNLPILLLFCALPGGLAAFMITLAHRARLELRPESLTMTMPGFRLVTPWTNIAQLGPSPRNPRHLALLLHQTPPVFEGRIAEAFRQRGQDQVVDLGDFVSDAPDDPIILALRRYAPHL